MIIFERYGYNVDSVTTLLSLQKVRILFLNMLYFGCFDIDLIAFDNSGQGWIYRHHVNLQDILQLPTLMSVPTV